MQTRKVAPCFGPLSFSMLFLVSMASMPALHAQAPTAGASVAVRMIEAIDSSKDPAGKQYRASVTKAVDAGNGVVIPQGAAAAVTLANSGSGWTTQLVSVTMNGQPVAVSSGPASMATGMQSAASNAVGAVSSMLSGFGHHVKPATGVTAVAMGQRVFLPPGATLTFVLSQPPASGPAAPAAPSAVATSGAPTPQPATTAAAPGPSQADSSAATSFYCLTALTAQNIIYYSPIEHRGQASTQGEIENAFADFLQKTYGIRVSTTCTSTVTNTTNVSDRQQKIDDYRRSYKVVETSWVYTPAGGPAGPAAPVAIWTGISQGAPFISCSTSGGAGIDSYITGVFQTTHPVKHLPNGGNLVDQGVLDRFYAYLTQKGYKFKPGSNYGCAVEQTEAQAKAAQHTRYESGGCSNCGKVVETGWTDTQ